MDSAGAPQRLICPACNVRYEHGQFCAKDGTPLIPDNQAKPKTDLVGRILADRYRILRLLGEGGMGQVYEAQHVNINKRFAIKLLRAEIVSNAEAVARFRQEAWSASSIGHENIIEIDDFATLPDGSVYLAMEFLDGQSLAERMREPNLIDAVEGLDIFHQVAMGLGAAHDKGIIHRDMKPENVFVAIKRERLLVKILDFGIAKVSGHDGNKMTRTGAIFGTPHYMSPEQALGKPLDHRSDIYSVGVIMYEVFTGKVPFEAESFMGILTKHIMSQAIPPRQMAPERDIPFEVESLIMRCMAKEANDRVQTMHDLTAEIGGLLGQWAPELLLPRASGGMSVARPSGPNAQVPRASAVQGAVRQSQQGLGRPPSGAHPLDKRTPTGPIGSSARPIAPTELAPGGSAQMAAASAQLKAASASLQARNPTPLGGTPALTGPSANLDSVPYAYPPPKPRSNLGLWLGLLGLLVLGGGAAAFVVMRKADPVVETPKPVEVARPTVVEAPKPAEVPPPAAPAELEVIVDSVPPGARIMKDGKQLAETPDTVKVPPGQTLAVVLSKKGFVEEPVIVDPGKGRKVLIKLDKVARNGKRPQRALPHLPVYSMPAEQGGVVGGVVGSAPPPPVKPPPAVPPPQPPPATPPAGHHKKKDPFERVDDTPKKTPDVLNPY